MNPLEIIAKYLNHIEIGDAVGPPECCASDIAQIECPNFINPGIKKRG